jgi:hypothetical protein
MLAFRTLKTAFALGSAAVKLATTYRVASKLAGMIPEDKRRQLTAGFSELADKTQENMLGLLEKHAPDFTRKLVERNGGKQLTKADLEDAMAQILASQQQKPQQKAAMKPKAPAPKRKKPQR